MNEDVKIPPDVSLKCLKCSHAVRYVGRIKSGIESVKLYRCSHCKREFVGEELKKRVELKTKPLNNQKMQLDRFLLEGLNLIDLNPNKTSVL